MSTALLAVAVVYVVWKLVKAISQLGRPVGEKEVQEALSGPSPMRVVVGAYLLAAVVIYLLWTGR